MLSAAQLELLDTYCGADQLTLRAGVRDAYERVRDLDRRADELRELAGARDRELDLLTFELDEIEAAAPREGEPEELAAERDRLRHQDELVRPSARRPRRSCLEAGTGAAELLARGRTSSSSGPPAVDPGPGGLAERLAGLRYEADDLGSELRGYLLGVDGDEGPARAPA